MMPKKPALGLDPRVGTGFRTKSVVSRKGGRVDDAKASHPAVARRREKAMQLFNLHREQEWNPKGHVEKILGEIGEGDVTVACWEPGQIRPNHCHPAATEIY